MTSEGIAALARRWWPADSMPSDEPAGWFLLALESAAWHNCEVCEKTGAPVPSKAIACAAHSTYAVEQLTKSVSDMEKVLSMRGPALHPDVAADLEWVVNQTKEAVASAQDIKTFGDEARVAVIHVDVLNELIRNVEAALRADRGEART